MKSLREYINKSAVQLNKLDKLCKEWQRMTDKNYHSERLLDIANFFQLREFEHEFTHYITLPSMTVQDSHDRYELALQMYDIIEREFGKNVRDKVEATA